MHLFIGTRTQSSKSWPDMSVFLTAAHSSRCAKNVQTGCTGYVHIKLSPVNVIWQSLSLGAWWSEGRSSSSVSQFLSSCSWSACQMAVKWRDLIRSTCYAAILKILTWHVYCYNCCTFLLMLKDYDTDTVHFCSGTCREFLRGRGSNVK